MNLKDYFLEHKNKSKTDFANDVGISRKQLYRLIDGDLPHADVALMIIRATEGIVTLEDLVTNSGRKGRRPKEKQSEAKAN